MSKLVNTKAKQQQKKILIEKKIVDNLNGTRKKEELEWGLKETDQI